MKLKQNSGLLIGLGAIIATISSVLFLIALLIVQPLGIDLLPRREWMMDVTANWLLVSLTLTGGFLGLIWLKAKAARTKPVNPAPSAMRNPKNQPLTLGPEVPGHVWVCPFNTSELCRRIDSEHDLETTLALLKRYERGDTIDPKEFPRNFILRTGRVAADIMIGDYMFVSSAVADVLRTFDLGKNGLVPIDQIVTGRDRTPLPNRYYLLTLENRKEAFSPDDCDPRAVTQIADGIPMWHILIHDHPDGAFAVDKTALAGPDIWFDPRTPKKLYCSDRLKTALDAQGIGHKMGFKRCRVVLAQ